MEEGRKARLEAAERFRSEQIRRGKACKECRCDFEGVRWVDEELIEGVCATCRSRKQRIDGQYSNLRRL
jgi:Zn finger protein HypA/HybF involved in hydrogenase expression